MNGRIDIISASAGSGKTTRLARELEMAVTERGISPERIVAMTFTRKAAAELVRRGRDVLLRKGHPDDAELFAAARIGTVNAVAGMFVSEFAFEAGVSPEVIVLDEVRASEAFRRGLGEVVSRDDLDELARLSGRFDDFPWQSIVQDIADAARTNHIGMDALDSAREFSVRGFLALLDPAHEDAETLDHRLELALERAITQLRASQQQGLDTTKKSAETLVAYERAWTSLQAKRSLPWSEWVALVQREAAVKSDSICAEVRQAAQVLLRHPGFREDNELAIRLCFDLAQRALTVYQRFKLARRAIDFIDQETIALQLLARPDVQEVLRQDIALVLIDEFQDSSPLELALFLALSRIAPHSVWVGDQKQAIYGFRGADPALTENVIAELLHDRESETLNIGRRSRAPLVHLTNALFVPPFRDAGLPPARVTLEPAMEDDPMLGPCLERWRLEARYQADSAMELATLVRQFLDDDTVRVRGEGHVPRRVRRGDMAILCRRRATCLTVANALEKVHVDVEIALGGLLATPEGRAASAGLRLWATPEDLLARAELVRLMQPQAAHIDMLVDGSNKDRWSDVDPIAHLLAARENSPYAGALEAFDAITRALRLDDVVLQWGRGLRAVANLDALRAHAVNFVRLARHRGGASSPAALVAYLEGLAADTDDAQAAPSGTDAIAVTTWHAAKGLEWPIVILYEIDGSFPRSVFGVHVDDLGKVERRLDAPLAGRTIRYWPKPLQSRGCPLHARVGGHPVAEEVAMRAMNEELRLLYVGFSRARDRLVLAGNQDLAKGVASLFARGGGIAPDEPTVSANLRGVAETNVLWGGCRTTLAVRKANVVSPPRADESMTAGAWILDRPLPRTYEPALVAAAFVSGQGRIAQWEQIGSPLSIRTHVDPIALGLAVHAFLAADRPTFDHDDRTELASRLLEGWGVAEALSVDDMVTMGRNLSAWLGSRHPEARLFYEWPVEQQLDAGTVLRGRVDLVAKQGDALVVIDHKVVLANEVDAWEEIRGAFGQLQAYANALIAANMGRSAELWVHLPLAGVMVRLS